MASAATIVFDIRPGRGVGGLRFGAGRPEVAKLLGDPDRVEKDEVDGVESESWHYDRLALSLHFEGGAGSRLDLIDVGSLEAQLFGLRPIGLEVEEARKLYDGRVGFVLDTEFPGTGGAVYDLPGTSVSLWFQEGFCDSVQVLVPMDDQGNYLWPAD